jgi:beta-fructofuranosidase
MFYTGTSREDGGDIQRIGAATSKDLLNWMKISGEAMVEADSAHYELLDYEIWHDQAWRDPWVFQSEDQRWHMLITARSKSGQRFERGVAAHAVSDDLRNWEVLPPVTKPDTGFGQMEVIQVVEIDGVPTMIWCCGVKELSEKAKAKYGTGGMFSVTGGSLLGPFDVSQAVRFPHPSLYAARVVKHEGKWYMLGFIDEIDGKFVGELSDPIPIKLEGGGLVIEQ